MTEEENYVHHVVDCSTGKTTFVPETLEERQERETRAMQARAVMEQQEAEEQAFREAVANHPDEIVRKLAARLGYGPNPS